MAAKEICIRHIEDKLVVDDVEYKLIDKDEVTYDGVSAVAGIYVAPDGDYLVAELIVKEDVDYSLQLWVSKTYDKDMAEADFELFSDNLNVDLVEWFEEQYPDRDDARTALIGYFEEEEEEEC